MRTTTPRHVTPRPRRGLRPALRLACGALMALTIAGHAYAQGTATPQPYLDLGVAADADWNTYAPDVDTVPALVAGAGIRSARGWTLRVEGSVPAWHEAPTYEQYVRTASNNPARLLITEAGRARHQLVTVAGLVGREFPVGRRVSLTPLGGLGVAVHRDRESGTRVIEGPTGTTSTPLGCECDDQSLVSLQWGIDTPIAVTRRLSIVPQLRFHAVVSDETYGRMFRPAVTARLRF